MTFLFSVFFGAGVAAFVYSKMQPRLGYGNTQSLWTITGVVLLIATIFFYTILAVVLEV